MLAPGGKLMVGVRLVRLVLSSTTADSVVPVRVAVTPGDSVANTKLVMLLSGLLATGVLGEADVLEDVGVIGETGRMGSVSFLHPPVRVATYIIRTMEAENGFMVLTYRF